VAALTGKQRVFIEAYLATLNATEAARRAGYAQPSQQGWQVLRSPAVAAAIAEGLAERAMPSDEVVERIAAIARGDVRDLMQFSKDGQFVGLNLTSDAPLHLIKSITENKYGWRIELYDRLAALNTLARIHGLLIDFSKLPQELLDALAAGQLTVDDLKRLANTSETPPS
jgi:phage terminase small subunit